jgi:hypothetical protein
MGLDIRLPIGMMFSLLGILLAGYGLYTNGDTAMYASSLNININIWWGLVLLAFGLFMLIPAIISSKKNSKT